MLRISKLTDYGIVCLAHFARHPERPVQSAREVAAAVRLPLPTVAKVFKPLARAGLLVSIRGACGGYRLGEVPSDIDVARIITALEGPIAVTECSLPEDGHCDTEEHCALRNHWPHINLAVQVALQNMTLADLIVPLPDVHRTQVSGSTTHPVSE